MAHDGRSGLNVVGYFGHVIGIGESARRCTAALRAAGIPHALAAIEPVGADAPPLEGSRVPELEDAALPYATTVLWCNPDRYGLDVEPRELPGERLIGRWAWELSVLPDEWIAAAAGLDEIWTPSTFVATAVAGAVDVPVRIVRPPVGAPRARPLDRERWSLPPEGPLFAFLFDHNSTVERKNPLGLIEAFDRAFGSSPRATLFIKTINAARAPDSAERLGAAAAPRPGVVVADAVVGPAERNALLAGCDCYVSLHRSEGFGLTMAEAMAFGRPVIATGYGGNVDFMDELTAGIVRFSPTPVGMDVPIYAPDATWAEPDLEHAAALMRAVVEKPAATRARAARGRERVRRLGDPASIGAAIRAALAGAPASRRT